MVPSRKSLLVAISVAILIPLAGIAAAPVAADCGGVYQTPDTQSPNADCVGLATTADGSTMLAGTGAQDSPGFYLPSGTKTVTWTATAPDSDTVNFAGFLKPLDPNQPGWVFLANVVLRPSETQSGSVNLPAESSGAYYLTSIGGATWTVNIGRPPFPALVAANPPVSFATGQSLMLTPGPVVRGFAPPPPTLAPVPVPRRPRVFTPRPTRTPRPHIPVPRATATEP